MSRWPAAKAQRVLAAPPQIGWTIKGRWVASHLAAAGVAGFCFAFHDGDEIGPRMLARIAKHTGLSEDDL